MGGDSDDVSDVLRIQSIEYSVCRNGLSQYLPRLTLDALHIHPRTVHGTGQKRIKSFCSDSVLQGTVYLHDILVYCVPCTMLWS